MATSIRLHYNAPVILTFSIICVVVFMLNELFNDQLSYWFSVGGSFHFKDITEYPRLFLHPIGHVDTQHLLGNLTFILLLGPVIEEKYGPRSLLIMMMITALLTAVLNILFFNSGLMGASGIVFMLILLISFVNVKQGQIPITFILVFAIYVGAEIYNSFQNDNISQFAHIIGGLCGSFFGFARANRRA